jgi:hypothetical protein
MIEGSYIRYKLLLFACAQEYIAFTLLRTQLSMNTPHEEGAAPAHLKTVPQQKRAQLERYYTAAAAAAVTAATANFSNLKNAPSYFSL